jgi:diaminohydroxyphosphoribosylaminopyrimidine deaminase / 5-amino-6-(5-phosphoribosylamino)uracil reductase
MASRDPRDRLMGRALELAVRGRTSPNPQVGAVVVSGGEVVGEGWHVRCGGPHAEVNALARAGDLARGADLYVTLEPCNHLGRTPPCTDAILAAGIARVLFGFSDPDPNVAGGGTARLAAEGVEVVAGVAGERCRRFYEAYTVHRRLGRAHVTLKAAATLDGRIATRTGHSRWVTGPDTRRFVHRLRDRVDAIMVGVGTVLADDPQLTTRLAQGPGHDPVRVIVDSRARTPAEAHVIRHGSFAETIVAHIRDPAAAAAAARLAGPGVVALECEAKAGRVDLHDLLRRLAARGIVTVLAEGGGELHWSLLEAGLADRMMLFMAPVIVGGRAAVPVVGGEGVEVMSDAISLEELKIHRLGRDLLLEGRPSGPARRGAAGRS